MKFNLKFIFTILISLIFMSLIACSKTEKIVEKDDAATEQSETIEAILQVGKRPIDFINEKIRKYEQAKYNLSSYQQVSVALSLRPQEYSVHDFDGSEFYEKYQEALPYSSPSLYKVFEIMDALTKIAGNQGIAYSLTSGWEHEVDVVNLAKGIDCARAIWYVFTRARLNYSTNSMYVNTKEMAKDDSEMNNNFFRCSLDEPFKPGDVLVYRSDLNKDGHVVIAVDYDNKIAWGSHSWDGEKKIKADPVTKYSPVGTEYQMIFINRDWSKWDKDHRTLRACWRHKVFIEETTM